MTNALDVIQQHAVYISDDDERLMDQALFSAGGMADYDHADIARRTCLCGARIDGFDDYNRHLRDKISETIE